MKRKKYSERLLRSLCEKQSDTWNNKNNYKGGYLTTSFIKKMLVWRGNLGRYRIKKSNVRVNVRNFHFSLISFRKLVIQGLLTFGRANFLTKGSRDIVLDFHHLDRRNKVWGGRHHVCIAPGFWRFFVFSFSICEEDYYTYHICLMWSISCRNQEFKKIISPLGFKRKLNLHGLL